MKKIIEFFKKLFGGKVEEVKPASTPKPKASQPKPSVTPKPQGTGIPKVAELSEEVQKPKPKKRYYGKPKNGGSSSGNGKQPYNTK